MLKDMNLKHFWAQKKLIASRPCLIWIVEIISAEAGAVQNGSANEIFSMFAKAGYSVKCIDPLMTETDGPVQGVTNYVFFNKEKSIEKII